MLIRLQKIIAQAGISSRRKAEDLIRSGAVTVNGKVVREMGTKADPEKDHIKIDGRRIASAPPKIYLLMHKPIGVVTTLSDPQGRPTVKDLLRGIGARVFPVGRLDYDSEGLVLLTNDGALAHRLMHPRYEVPKVYQVKIKGVLSEEELGRLRQGFILPGGRMARARVEKIGKGAANSWLEFVLSEGQKRQIRRMIEKMGHTVIKLKRIRLGNLDLGDLAPGAYRHLRPEEIRGLKNLVEKRRKEAGAGRRKASVALAKSG